MPPPNNVPPLFRGFEIGEILNLLHPEVLIDYRGAEPELSDKGSSIPPTLSRLL